MESQYVLNKEFSLSAQKDVNITLRLEDQSYIFHKDLAPMRQAEEKNIVFIVKDQFYILHEVLLPSKNGTQQYLALTREENQKQSLVIRFDAIGRNRNNGKIITLFPDPELPEIYIDTPSVKYIYVLDIEEKFSAAEEMPYEFLDITDFCQRLCM